MQKQIGNVVNMSLNLTAPIKLNMTNMNFNHICILVGQNGLGKTLILKINWCFNMIANGIVQRTLLNIERDDIKDAQFIFDNSFDDFNFNGTVKVNFENATLSIVFNTGTVENVNLESDEGVIPNGVPKYMSKETRTYHLFIQYMKVKKMLSISESLESVPQDKLKKLLVMFKLYDILMIEDMLKKLENFQFPQNIKDAIINFSTNSLKNIKGMSVDKKICEIYAEFDNDEKRSVLTLSAGEQSIINLVTTQHL